MEDLKKQLKADFQHSESVDERTGRIDFASPWAGRTQGVKKITVYLSGTDPLTGEILDNKGIRFEYTLAQTSGSLSNARYWGEFLLRYDAVLSDGGQIPDCIPPRKISLRVPGKQPELNYTVEKEKNGYSKVTLNGNCLERCSGHLWFRYQGGYHRVPKLGPAKLVPKIFYFPGQDVIELISDAGFPVPKLKG